MTLVFGPLLNSVGVAVTGPDAPPPHAMPLSEAERLLAQLALAVAQARAWRQPAQSLADLLG